MASCTLASSMLHEQGKGSLASGDAARLSTLHSRYDTTGRTPSSILSPPTMDICRHHSCHARERHHLKVDINRYLLALRYQIKLEQVALSFALHIRWFASFYQYCPGTNIIDKLRVFTY